MSTLNPPSSARQSKRAHYFEGLVRRYSQYRSYRQTLDELQSLSDRELADLGVHRSQLRSIAYRAAYDG